MSRVSSLVLGAVVVGIFATGCQASLTVKTKNRFVPAADVTKADTADWAGQAIEINIAGVGIALNGGVTVISDPSATKVSATSRMLAMALAEEQDNAELSINEAESTFTVSSTADTVSVNCGHGGTHGSSDAGSSGCELVTITVPAGDATHPLKLTQVLSGNGTIKLQLSNAYLTNLGTNASGGDTIADLPDTVGGSISLVAEKSDNISATFATGFSADDVILQADADKIDLGPFSDLKNGAGAGGVGTKGAGLASLKITSKDFAGSTGTITLATH